jgi:hypothetical protein
VSANSFDFFEQMACGVPSTVRQYPACRQRTLCADRYRQALTSLEIGVFEPMCWNCLIRSQLYRSSAVVVAVAVVLFLSAANARAGILVPRQVGFAAGDIDRSLQSSSTSTGQHSGQNLPASDRDEKSDPLSLLKASLPTSNSSSSSSSSTAGGVGSGVCLLDGTIVLQDDACFGQLAERRGLDLPDPPGTDLLRPPRG